METKLILLKRTFEDFFGPGLNPTKYTGSVYIGTGITTNATNVYVYNCIFRFCSSSSHGGAIHCGINVRRLLVEQSSLISCKTSDRFGGGIYFNNVDSGECVLSRICGFNCSTGEYMAHGLFACIDTKNDVSAKNHVNDSSVTHSSKKSGSTYHTLILNNGKILCPSVNLTNNECSCYAVLGCFPSSSSTTVTFCISYGSIVNNTANSGYCCLRLHTTGSLQCIDTCNILNNNQSSSNSGTIETYAYLFIKDSCILGNNKGNKVFCAYSPYRITISNCTIDDDIFKSGRYSGIVTVNKTIERTFNIVLSHFAYCDVIVKLIVLSECPRCLLSCNNKSAFRYFEFLFLFTMIHSGPDNDNYFDSNCIFAADFY